MLKFQCSDYCMLIWDDEHTEYHKALVSLESEYQDDESANYSICIPLGKVDYIQDDMDRAKEILEKAADLFGCVVYDGGAASGYRLADIIVSCVSMARYDGLDNTAMAKEIREIICKQKKNKTDGK